MAMEISDRQLLLQKKKKSKHVLVMPGPGVGHITPMMQFSRMLSSAGIAVTFVTTDFYHRRLLRSMAQLTPQNALHLSGSRELLQNTVDLDVSPGSAPIRLIGIPDGVSDQDYIVIDVQKQCQGLIDMTDRLTELALSLRPPITSVIGDIFCICTPPVARRLEVPHVGFWTQSAASYAAHALCVRNPAHFKELMKVNDDKNHRPISCIPGCPALKPTEINTFLQSCDPSEFFFNYLSQNFGDEIMKHSHVVVNSFEALEPEALEFVKGHRPDVLVMGPLLPEEYLRRGVCENRRVSICAEDKGCLEWLDKQPEGSVLYVAFGSVARLSAAQVAELAAGLERSGCRILMVVRRALVEGEDAVLPTSFAESERLKLVDWAPQLAVLAHHSVGGFLTHGGWNSTTEAIANGVPMLCWPYFGDQMMNCRCIVDYWKIGLDFQADESTGLISRAEILAKVECLVDLSLSHDMRMRARDLSILAKEARNTSKRSQSSLESLLTFLHK